MVSLDYDHLIDVFCQASIEQQILYLGTSLYYLLLIDALTTRSVWVDSLLLARLYQDLREDDAKFFRYFRMKCSTLKVPSRLSSPAHQTSNHQNGHHLT